MVDYFSVKARERERAFVRAIKTGSQFRTGSGSVNVIVEVGEDIITFRSARSNKPVRFPRHKFREAIRYIFLKRTATRKNLDRFHNYSSALMGLLRLVFADISRVARTFRGLLRLSLKGVRFAFSGLDRSPKDMRRIKQYGGTTILLSYFYLRDDKNARWLHHVRDTGLLVLLDSGEFSRWKAEKRGKEVRPLDVVEYAEFIRRHKDAFIGWMNLDVVGDGEASRWNAEYLKAQGLPPIEIWHVQSPWEELERIIRADHDCIAIGGSADLSVDDRREIFNELFSRFPGQNYHILGASSPIVADFPWFSADSKSWMVSRAFGKLVTPTKQFKAPTEWDVEQCMSYTIGSLSSMENNYDESYQSVLLPTG